jgi:hypothetical protein
MPTISKPAVNKKPAVLNSGMVLQQKSKKLKDYLLLANTKLSKVRNEDFENALLLHLRFNYKFSSLSGWKTFTPLQSNLAIEVQPRIYRLRARETTVSLIYGQTAYACPNMKKQTGYQHHPPSQQQLYFSFG